ncbi:MAG: hypothetical protein MJY56_04120 [Bacteroidales bacterium]|nr:hypothetical protein [Bacteroidales bacterium]
MKRFLLFISIAALAVTAVSASSCARLEPSEITGEAYPFTATCMVTAKANGVPTPNTEVVFDITDLTSSRTYTIKRTTNSTGTLLLEIGCGSKGVSVNAQLLATVAGVNCYGSANASLNSTNKFYATITIDATK